MGKVDCFYIRGVDCWFWSRDHKSPHFNAKKKGEWYFKVFFLKPKEQMLDRVKGSRGRVSKADRKMLCQQAKENRKKLLTEWEKKVLCDA
jgi:hypothetical protein